MPRTVLLADDSVTIQTAVGMTFASEDVTLVTAKDGEEALQRARESKPDIILADVRMPRLGGYELCERVRADAALKNVPVLLLGGEGPIDPSKAIGVGANGHLPKPFDSQKLIDSVKQILANPSARGVMHSAAASRPPPPAGKPGPVASQPPRPIAATGQTIPLAKPPPLAAGKPPPTGAPGARPPAPGTVPPRPSPMSAPGAKPAPASAGAPMARGPSAPPPARPPLGAQPGKPAPMASKPPPMAGKPAPSMPPGALRPPPPASKPPPMGAKPAAGSAPPSAARPGPAVTPPRDRDVFGFAGKDADTQRLDRPPPAPEDDDEIAIEEDVLELSDAEEVDDAAAAPPAQPQLRAVPQPKEEKPALSIVPPAEHKHGDRPVATPLPTLRSDGGEAVLREALSKASREVIEKIAWEVVPELAETIIREELERLMKERGA